MTGATVYAGLRLSGAMVLPIAMTKEEQATLAASARRLARRDGLQVVQHRHRRRGQQGPYALRHHSELTLNLVHPDRPTLLVAPDDPDRLS